VSLYKMCSKAVILWAYTKCVLKQSFFSPWRNCPRGQGQPHCSGVTITLRHTTLGRTPLDEWSARRRDLYLIIHNTQERNIYAPNRIRTRNPSKRAAVHPPLRPRGHWDRNFKKSNWLSIHQ